MPRIPTCKICKETMVIRNRKWVCKDHDTETYESTPEDRLRWIEDFLEFHLDFHPLPRPLEVE